jgi:hypothetical protein
MQRDVVGRKKLQAQYGFILDALMQRVRSFKSFPGLRYFFHQTMVLLNEIVKLVDLSVAKS